MNKYLKLSNEVLFSFVELFVVVIVVVCVCVYVVEFRSDHLSHSSFKRHSNPITKYRQFDRMMIDNNHDASHRKETYISTSSKLKSFNEEK